VCHEVQQRTDELGDAVWAHGVDLALEHAVVRGVADDAGDIVRKAWICDGRPADCGMVVQAHACTPLIPASGRVPAFRPLSLPGVALFAGCTVGPNYWW
jgi:hypothetical protein